jgi:hypothetical protein
MPVKRLYQDWSNKTVDIHILSFSLDPEFVLGNKARCEMKFLIEKKDIPPLIDHAVGWRPLKVRTNPSAAYVEINTLAALKRIERALKIRTRGRKK